MKAPTSETQEEVQDAGEEEAKASGGDRKSGQAEEEEDLAR
jgi:hypothetical protein